MPIRWTLCLGAALAAATLAACNDFKPPRAANSTLSNNAQVNATTAANAGQAANAIPVINPPAMAQGSQPSFAPASTHPQGQAIETAAADPAAKPSALKPFLIRVEVLLDRAHFSPGAIDGTQGSNLAAAAAAYRSTHNLPAGGGLDAALLQSLIVSDTGPVTEDYVITVDDEKGPFLGTVPSGMEALSKLPRVGYATPREELAEKFRMSETLLSALNPGADFSAAGTTIVVIQSEAAPLPEVAKVEVDKAANQVRALSATGQILAVFPATVGSTERPAPSGDWAVKSVTVDPDYTYDPSRLTFGPRSKGKLTIAPGPNNPVGDIWIALTAETYGIHGTPDPTKVGKTASHGCVRLTNWDALALGHALAKGVPVSFVGETTKT